MRIVEPERVLFAHRVLTFDASQEQGDRVELAAVFCTGTPRISGGKLVTTFVEGDTHKLRLLVGRPFCGNGFSARLYVSGFESLEVLLFGFVLDGTLRRITVPNLWQERWVDVSFSLGDLIFGIQNDWHKLPSGQVSELHLHFTGRTRTGVAEVTLDRLEIWDERVNDFGLVVAGRPTTFSVLREQPSFASQMSPLRPELLAVVDAYLERFNHEADAQAEVFMSQGNLPSFRASLPWPFDATLPPSLDGVNSYRWSWQGLHAVPILLRRAQRTGDVAPIFAARELVTLWLERSYYQVDSDGKYCWYDQGVGDRLLALVLIWDRGLRLGFDQRFMTRVLEAISRHVQLLGTEAFYASHQETRYHNHAVFQDIWLMFATLAIPQLAGAQRYFELAVARITDQIARLLVKDGDCAVLIENSVSYHVGFQWMVEFADDLIRLGGGDSHINRLAPAMRRFVELATYPDGRLPGLGDSPRVANGDMASAAPELPDNLPELTLLPKAGHVFIRGQHEGRAFMLTLSATSLTETHKHADNLAFTLFFDGIEWLIDPSFKSYEPSQPVSNYLRGAFAHNAVALRGLPYSLASGIARVNATRSTATFEIEGQHDAYEDARVERVVRGRFDTLFLDFVERVRPEAADFNVEAVLMLHCGDGVTASLNGDTLLLRHPASTFALRLTLPTATTRAYHGEFQDGEPRGFTGLGFMEDAPVTTIECALERKADARWKLAAVPAS